MKFVNLVSTLFIISLFTGCGNIIMNSTAPLPPDGSGDPIETIVFDKQVDGKYLFFTNDATKLGIDGRSYWAYSYETFSPLSVWDVRVQKVSGQSNMGFGIIFNLVNSSGKYSFWAVLINNEQKYRIEKFILGTETVQKDWTTSPSLIIGNAQNRIRVTYTPADQTYRVYFNGVSTPEISFKDESTPVLASGALGFVANTGSTEVFPGFPCKIFYEVLNPTTVTF